MSPSVFTSVINSYLPEPHASLLNGILFGIPIKASRQFYLHLQEVGLLHLVVLSGTNISILAGAVASTLNFLPKKVSLSATVVSIVLFTLFVGPQPPIVRAAVMGILAITATLYGKKSTALISLLVAVVAVCIFKPDWLTGISFQLSTGATLGIILFGSGKEILGRKPATVIINCLIKEVRITLAASVFTVPLIFYYFKQISFIAPLANLLVAWVIPPLMAFGTAASLLGKISWVLGLPASYICFGLLEYMIAVIDKLSEIPFAFCSY